jgi:molybdate transport system substrate-binding protein
MPRDHRRVFVVVGLLLALLLSACGTGGATPEVGATPTATAGSSGVTSTGEITVFAAASLADAFEQIAQRFEAKNVGAKVVLNLAGSQQLARQILEGAPADVFASASGKHMDVVVAGGRIQQGRAQAFARNRLVVIYPKQNPANIRSLQDLARPRVKIDLAAKEVPAGQYSLEFLDAAAQDREYGAEYRSAVLKNVVSYEENVRAVVGKVALGEADAGIVYESDVVAEGGKLGTLEIPEALNPVATYPIAPIVDAKHGDAARDFVAYVLSDEGQSILEENGFVRVGE